MKVAFWVLKTSDHLLQLSPVLAALTLQGQGKAQLCIFGTCSSLFPVSPGEEMVCPKDPTTAGPKADQVWLF